MEFSTQIHLECMIDDIDILPGDKIRLQVMEEFSNITSGGDNVKLKKLSYVDTNIKLFRVKHGAHRIIVSIESGILRILGVASRDHAYTDKHICKMKARHQDMVLGEKMLPLKRL